MEFVTLTKREPEFKKYLWGTFSKQQMAIAVETYDAFSTRERVTFRIESVESIQKPQWWKIYLLSARPEMWLLSLGPAISALLLLLDELDVAQLGRAFSALIALFFLHNAACLANDVQDHLSGSDRANRRRGSQVIQKGWSTARSMLLWSGVNLACALLFGWPAVVFNPLPVLFVVALALGAIFCVVSAWRARWGIADVSVGLLYGPLIVLGMDAVVSRALNVELLLVGMVFGWVSMWVLQARQLENLFRSQREGHRTFVGYLDFDRAKIVFLAEGVLAIACAGVSAWWIVIPPLMWWLFPVVCVPFVYVLLKTWHAASPLSSDFVRIGRHALLSHGALTVWFWLSLGFL